MLDLSKMCGFVGHQDHELHCSSNTKTLAPPSRFCLAVAALNSLAHIPLLAIDEPTH
jgi:hypothetical protein